MKNLFAFEADGVLTEQVALIYRNFLLGILAYVACATMAAASIYKLDQKEHVVYWYAACLIASATVIVRYFLYRQGKINSTVRQEAKAQVLSLFLIGAVWASLYLIAPPESVITVSIMVVLTAGINAGGLTMQSPSFSVFAAFALSSMSYPALYQVFQGGFYNIGIGLISLTFIGLLVVCAYNIQATIVGAIKLRIRNEELVGDLSKALESAKKANRAKSVFLASASHDLRQPLHAMGLFVESLKRSDPSDHQSLAIENIVTASTSTRRMLDTLLDFSKIDAGVIDVNKTRFRLQDLLYKLETELAPAADHKKIIYRTRDCDFVVNTDMVLLELVLRNLISNAIRYTPAGGILITARKRYADMPLEKNIITMHQSPALEVAVWDTGIGIQEDQVENIFEEYHQVANPERDSEKGFGLGLAIVKGLVEKMGVGLSMSSKEGRGSVFKLLLPYQPSEVMAEVIPVEHTAEIIAFNSPRILFIDDNPHICMAMENMLNVWNCQCLVAESQSQAMDLMSQSKYCPDLLIVDYRLREQKTGGEAIEAIREYFNQPDLPAIIITGDTAVDRLQEAQSFGAPLLHKPVDGDKLQKIMFELLP